MKVFSETLGVLWRSIAAFFIAEYAQPEDPFANVPAPRYIFEEDMPKCGGVLCTKRRHSVTCPRKIRSAKKKSAVKKSSAKKSTKRKSPAKKSVRKKSRA